jgi:cell division septation protein DedD
MKRYLQILFVLSLLFSGCKSNQEAYNATYRKFKEMEKENSVIKSQARTPMDVPQEVMSKDSAYTHVSEAFTIIVGQEKNVSVYNIVAKSFINQTNAKGYHERILNDGYPAVLVQNENSMFRIIIAAFQSKEEAEKKLELLKKTFTTAWILARK